MRLDQVPPRVPRGNQVHVIIDTPAGSANKYKFDETLGLFRVSRKLPEGLVFPCNFGSIPGTMAEDGDPLDVLVVGLPPCFPGCLITTRLLGVLRARQVEKGRTIANDRLIGVGETPVNRSRLRTLADLPAQSLADIAHFFESYNAAQGRPFKVVGRGNRHAAETAVSRGIDAFARDRRDKER